jgi:hypothetical protein
MYIFNIKFIENLFTELKNEKRKQYRIQNHEKRSHPRPRCSILVWSLKSSSVRNIWLQIKHSRTSTSQLRAASTCFRFRSGRFTSAAIDEQDEEGEDLSLPESVGEQCLSLIKRLLGLDIGLRWRSLGAWKCCWGSSVCALCSRCLLGLMCTGLGCWASVLGGCGLMA